jgi:hypothetical protein
LRSGRLGSGALGLLLLLLGPELTSAGPCRWSHEDREMLIGGWRWVHTLEITGNGVLESTPESAGLNQRLVLREDNQFEFFLDGELVQSGGWCLRESEDMEPPAGRIVLYLAGFGGFEPGADGASEYFPTLCGVQGCGGFTGPTVQDGIMLSEGGRYLKFEVAGITTPVTPARWSALKARYR